MCLTPPQMHLRRHHFPRFSQRFTPCFHCFTDFFHGFTRFFHGFIQFSRGFTWFFQVLLNFSRVLIDCSMVFSHFPIVLLHFSLAYQIFRWFYSIFPLFFHGFTRLLHNFTLPFQSPQMHLGGRTRGESIPHRHPIATWYITLKKVPTGTPPLHLIPWFCVVLARPTPRPPITHFFRKRNFA